MSINPTGAVLPPTPPTQSPSRQAAPDSGFAVAGGPAEPGQAAPSRLAFPVSNAGAMLALQEQAAEASDRSADVADREARRHGQDMLEALAALQKALLADVDPQASLFQLAKLANVDPRAYDPALAQIVSSIRLRAKLELLRRSPVHASMAMPPGPPSKL